MLTIVQTLADANQFTGTGSAGYVDFSQIPIPPGSPDKVPVVTSISLENIAAEQIPTVDCFFVRPGEALTTTERITVRNVTANTGFSLAGCRIPVPILVVSSPTIFTPWPLVLVTTGKTLTASFVVSFQLGQAITAS
jgi:hypothetical protein